MTQQARFLESAWIAVRGRCRRESLSETDGFRGDHPFASVLTVAEGTGGDDRSASIAVSMIRDVFAEGVAFRVGEALVEALHEAGERIRTEELRGCSVTAVAFLGREVWIAHAGASRAFLVESSTASPLTAEHTLACEMKLSPRDPAYKLRSKDLTSYLGQQDLRPQVVHVDLTSSQRIALMTPGVWHNIQPPRIAAAASRRADPCEAAEILLKESRARFRRSGGAAAVIGEQAGRLASGRRRRFILPAALALVLLTAFLLVRGPSCGNGPDPVILNGGGADAPWVMPLQVLSEEMPEVKTGPGLPVRTLVFGDSIGLPPSDTLDVFITPPADSLYENIPQGIFYLSSDSVMAVFARDLSDRFGLGEPRGLDRIVIVRETEVPAFAAWLPGVDSADAANTAVIVETSSSVAGGAAWIRRYAMYANGNRARQGEPSSYTGLPLEGLPAGLDPGCYSLLIAP